MDTEDRLGQIEARLTRIENYLKVATAQATPARPATVGVASRPSPLPSPPRPDIDNLQVASSNWLGIIAVICFILAAGFIVKLSIDSGWLTPLRQVGLAALLGFGLIGAGLRLLRFDRTYAAWLPAAGIVVLYIAAFAAHRLYHLLPAESALALIALVSAVCVWLYTRIRHEIYAVTAAAGAYLSPLLLDLNSAGSFTLYYLLLCSCAFAMISVWVQSRALTMVAAYLAILSTATIGVSMSHIYIPVYDGASLQVAILLPVHFLVFACATYFYSVHHDMPLETHESWAYLPVLLLFYGAEYYNVSQISPHLAPWLSLGFAGVLVGLYLAARGFFPQGLASQSLVVSFATLAAFHSAYLELLPDAVQPWLFPLIVLVAIVLTPQRLLPGEGSPYAVPALAVLAILGIEYVKMVGLMLRDTGFHPAQMAVGLISLASLWAGLARADNGQSDTLPGQVMLGMAHLLAITAFYRLVEAQGSLAVSAIWLAYAVAVIVFAFTRRDRIMAKSAVLVLGLAAGKVLLYDAAGAATVIRIACLLLTGATLYGCGLLLRRTDSWKTA